jgi:mono/diheme cytochrome c family protein
LVRRRFFWVVIAGMTAGLAVNAFAQKAAGSAQAGARFAEIWCSGCHAVELKTTRSGGIAPDFPTIANRKSTTARSLHAYLKQSHDKMPNFVLDKEDADDVVAYLMSLKRR